MRTRREDWRLLRGTLWLAHALDKSGLNAGEFARRYVHRDRSRSNLVAKWLAGSAAPNRLSALRLEKFLPGTLEIFDLPLFPLLADRPMSLRSVQVLIARYRKQEVIGFAWKFPSFQKPPTYSFLPDETSALLERADLWGMFGIAALVRQAEASGDGDKHVACCKDLYRAVIPLAKVPWIAPSMPLLKKCIDVVRERVHLSSLLFDVDWSSIEGSSNSESPAEIILDAQLVRGVEVRKRKMTKEAIRSRKTRSSLVKPRGLR